jgi:hypothetical protein
MVMVCFCPEEAAAGVAAAVAAAVATVVAAGVLTAFAVVGTGVADDLALSVQPAARSDTKRSAARHTVTITYELRLLFMVFDHDISPSEYTVFRHRIYIYICNTEIDRGIP